ncbi:MAG: UPF0280 family protein [Desulfobacterales bacterium]|uniref:UPF0280 family protein n=1 Tax=Candidatus Desulfatibia profunda TaxID=2841695 RepID=A0A8J6TN76_9BACT|nr:UPF0280 family protein [Candidatus Desulfatibia profunda]MBL7179315.1 UPF0280 family protein [Desulfobacterales bacterium]
MYQERTYRRLAHRNNLVSFRVTVKETDVLVHASGPLEDITKELILKYRGYLEAYIDQNPKFAETLQPWRISGPAPLIVKDMAAAGAKVGVGPMAAVAGAIAEHVGLELLSHTKEVVVENGGDIFFKTDGPVTIGIYAGLSPLSLRIGLRIDSGYKPFAVCTSSGTVGHSLSLGKADAVCVLSGSCSLADAAATSIGNRVQSKTDIQEALDFGKRVEGVTGIVVIIGDAIGMWGELEIIPLNPMRNTGSGKKG